MALQMKDGFVASEDTNAGTTVIPPQAPQGAPRPETGANTGPAIMGLRDLASVLPSTSGLSPEGKAYIERLIKIFDEMRTIGTPGASGIKITQLTAPMGAVIVESGNRICPIMMSETIGVNIDSKLPITIALQAIMESFTKFYPRTEQPKIVSPIVITPADYPKVEVMGSWLLGVLTDIYASNPITASILGGDNLMLSVNMQECKAFVERHSPHGIMARHDLAFKLSVVPQGGYQNRQNNDMFASYRNDATDIAVVTAYVEILAYGRDPNTGMPRFTPVIHITDVVSKIQDNRMFLMLTALAADVFQRAGFWRNQFTVFDKNRPNLGALMADPTTKALGFIGSQPELDNFMQAHLTQPVMVLDICDGRARIPDTELFILGTPESQNALKKEFEAIFGGSVNIQLPNVNASNLFGYELVGIAPIGGQIADTRWIDYLSLAVHHSQDLPAIAPFLSRIQGESPTVRFERQQKFFPDARALYSNNMVIVNLDYISAIQNEMRRYIKLAPGSYAQNQVALDLSSAIRDAQQYLQQAQSFNFGGAGGMGGQTTIVPGIYRNY